MPQRRHDATGPFSRALSPVLDPHRLAALDALELLDTETEEAFDRVTELAALSLGTPIAMVNLVDAVRQFTKSQVGFPDRAPGTCELPIESSTCRHVVESGEPLTISDARVHPLVAGTPPATQLGVVAYAGIPLITAGGHCLGALCVIDVVPRDWSTREIAILRGLAGSVMAQIELRATHLAERRNGERMRRAADASAARLRLVTDELEASQTRLRASREDAVRRLARAIELRSEETGTHIATMSRLCGSIARRLGQTEEEASALALASSLHDIGKIAIPDRILHKPGPLSAEERAIIETHPEIGHQMLVGADDEILDLAAEIALTHHERMDGGGYPRGLAGEAIPIAGRIAAVADVFDALGGDRAYRAAMPLPQVLALMEEGRGTHFDPAVLDALLAELTSSAARIQAAATLEPETR